MYTNIKKIQHFNLAEINCTDLVNSFFHMSFTARSIAQGSLLLKKAVHDTECSLILCIAGSTSAAGCMHVYRDMVKYNMVDAVVATGASIIDMDLFESLGFNHYQGSSDVDDRELYEKGIDRIYDSFIYEKDLQQCDHYIADVANNLEPGIYSSRQFIQEIARYQNKTKSLKTSSLIQECYKHNVPIFCPALNDSSAGLGLMLHQVNRIKDKKKYISLDSIQDLTELTTIKSSSKETGLIIIGGGVPKNFAQDITVASRLLNVSVPMHKYAIQITVADERDGACSSSTLKEALSWGKVDNKNQQMIYGEASAIIPIMTSYVFHNSSLKDRKRRNLNNTFL